MQIIWNGNVFWVLLEFHHVICRVNYWSINIIVQVPAVISEGQVFSEGTEENPKWFFGSNFY